MSERAAFIDAILDNPADDTARLVFADWLQENGEPERAEFIRVQIEAETLPEAELAESKSDQRAVTLQKEHEHAWRQAIGIASDDGTYSRGFLTRVQLYPQDFDGRVSRVLSIEPATFQLSLQANDDEEPIALKAVDALAADPRLRAITTIVSSGGRFGPKRFARLMKSPHLTNLRDIDISWDDLIGAAGIRAIANSPAGFELKPLTLA